MKKVHEIEILPDENGGFKAKYFIGGFPLTTKRFASAVNAAQTAAQNIWTDSPLAQCQVKDNGAWKIKL